MSRPRPIDIVFMAFEIWPEETAWEWFYGNNDYLDGQRPWDVLMRGEGSEVIKALDLEKA